ncbi:MAG: prepilin-type N-terminal cleavage/methylation domain-containing protein [Bacteriovoracaceae bacterium]|nr:prepilin-type N-terminal cleavage/methylation domain-containing protein [Bacteriovoracaceae bacterium]
MKKTPRMISFILQRRSSHTTPHMVPKKADQGFTLIEVLVALFLVVVIFTVVSNITFNTRQIMTESLDRFEKAIRFSNDEAALRNRIIRLHFFLDKTPQEYAVEYGPDDAYVIPISKVKELDSMSSNERKKHSKEIKDLNRKFNKIREFHEGGKTLPDGVKVLGIGTSIHDKLKSDFHSSIYIYPTGEKDSAIIILGTDDEVATLSINAFTMEFKRKFITLEDFADEDDLEDKQMDLAEGLFMSWSREENF